MRIAQLSKKDHVSEKEREESGFSRVPQIPGSLDAKKKICT